MSRWNHRTVFEPPPSGVTLSPAQVRLIGACQRAFLRSTRLACATWARDPDLPGTSGPDGTSGAAGDDTATVLARVADYWKVTPATLAALLPTERDRLVDEAVQDRLIRLLACRPTETEARAWQANPPNDEQVALVLALKGITLDGAA